ncbi:preprotein translocase subunit YajC [Sphingomonas sp. H39-1-10]|uniref:preprotein translocase subunit YajC n=1 Tax=Sphingomonas TaxID=13687 RepID=UPI000891A3AA|nr:MULTISPECIES: preprotein translocase subunit YajC [Sphingomonas]MDF0490694.1 preprotein translocase subunit YajC [Sphingomonas pollutisoli]SDA36663.1 preprotein translocase subunit YajC [Sphingomonas sp. NFR15]
MFATSALAASANSASAAGGGGVASMFLLFFPYIAIAVVGYFLLLRPQQQRIKAQQAKINAVKKGDSVVTAGGVLGKVTRVEDQYVEVEVAPNVRIRVVKATLTEVTNPLAKPAND